MIDERIVVDHVDGVLMGAQTFGDAIHETVRGRGSLDLRLREYHHRLTLRDGRLQFARLLDARTHAAAEQQQREDDQR